MATDVHHLTAWLFPIVVVALAAITCRLLRRVLRAGPELLAGLLVGLLLGPGLFGRVAPDLYLRCVEGSPDLFAAVQTFDREAAALEEVARTTGGDARQEAERITAARRDADEAWRLASESHRRPQLILIFALAALAMLAGGAAGVRLRNGPTSLADIILLGLWGALPTAALGIAWAALLGEGPMSSNALFLAAALAIGAWNVTGPERAVARGVDGAAARTALGAAIVASCLAAVIAAIAFADRGIGALSAVLVILALPLGQLRPIPRRAGRLFAAIALPGMVALAALRIEPFRDLAPWSLLILFILAEDGRWFAFAAGERLAGGRPWMETLRFALAPLRVGPPMAALAAIGLVTGLLEPRLGFALFGAALLIELLAPTRLRLARQVQVMELHPDPE